MVWEQTDRSASVWSLSEPTNVCRELGGKHSKAFLSAFKIAAPHSRGTLNKWDKQYNILAYIYRPRISTVHVNVQ